MEGRNVGSLGTMFGAGGPPDMARALLANNFNVEKALRVNSPLPVDAQKKLDNTFVGEFSDRLQVVRDLIADGLTFTLDRPFAFEEIEYHLASKTSGATLGRFPRSRTEHDIPDLEAVYTPIYYAWADFSLTLPQVEASRNRGLPLDDNLIRQKARNIAETIEESVIKGTVAGIPLPVVGGRTAYGLLNHPDVESVTLSGSLAWDNVAKTVDQIMTDVQEMFDKLDANRAFGPVSLYIPNSWMNAIRFKRNSNTDRTALELIEMQKRGGQMIRIREADLITADTAVMLVRSSLVVDLILGNFGAPSAPDDPNAPDSNPIPITSIPWMSPDGLSFNWKLIACIIPRPKSTYGDKSGIVKLS